MCSCKLWLENWLLARTGWLLARTGWLLALLGGFTASAVATEEKREQLLEGNMAG
jgi:hypothetical protein